MSKPKEQPMQPIVFDDQGTARFQENAIVRYILDAGPFDLNQIACLPGVSREDRAQFAQLIGYSVSGYGDLSYSLRVGKADRKVAKMLEARDVEQG